VRLLERDVSSGGVEKRNYTGCVVVIFSVGWKVGSEFTAA